MMDSETAANDDMMTDVALKIYGVPISQWNRCQRAAKQFLEEYPDRLGFINGAVYVSQNNDWPNIYVYRTKTMIVVRGTN